MRPLTPQNARRIAWEHQVCESLDALGLCRSDAQAVMEAVPELVDELFAQNLDPARAGLRIWSLPHR
ncbi:MAG TPA: hypothetical protein VN680_19255 [Burkholderiaceae bacterium]|nr:hypothetical protein [Burkholderiaceae bacterium]